MLSVIKPNTRVRFTAEDIEFILSVLRSKVSDAECLTRLLADEEARDLVLDDESLLRAILEHPNCLRVSAHFYFYILVRHALCRADLKERPLVIMWRGPGRILEHRTDTLLCSRWAAHELLLRYACSLADGG
jgi:hypothetical protein